MVGIALPPCRVSGTSDNDGTSRVRTTDHCAHAARGFDDHSFDAVIDELQTVDARRPKHIIRILKTTAILPTRRLHDYGD